MVGSPGAEVVSSRPDRAAVVERLRVAVRRRGLQVVDPWRSAERAIYVTGSARSGTTWVAETLAGRSTTRLVFEPLHHRARAARSAPHFAEPAEPGAAPGGAVDVTTGAVVAPVVGADAGFDAGLLAAIDDALTGRVRDPWVNAFQRAALVSRRVVKDIRPGLLPAVRRHAPGVPVVLVVRDPVAVARSRSRLEAAHGAWFRTSAALAELRARADGPDTALGRLARRAVSVLDGPLGGGPLVDHVVLWCVENAVALAAVDGPGRAAVVRHEELRTDPDVEFARLADSIGVRRRLLGDPSAGSATEFASGRDVEIGPADREVLVGIVHDFGLDRFLADTDADPRPH